MSKAAPAKTANSALAPVAHAREKNIELALSSITKQFGDGSIMSFADIHGLVRSTSISFDDSHCLARTSISFADIR